jgi:hypothetical protein
MFITVDYYKDEYFGTDDSDANITKAITRASDDINAMCNWQIDDITNYTGIQLDLLKKATAAQTEWYINNGDAYNYSEMEDVSIGKFSYTGKIKGSSKNTLCSRADMYLAQTGLMFRGVGITVDGVVYG